MALPENVPSCICAAPKWQGHGGSFGGMSQSNFKCKDCDRFGVHMAADGGNLFMLMRKPGEGLSERVADWFNGTVLKTWRANKAAFDEEVSQLRALVTPLTPEADRNTAVARLAELGAGGPIGMLVFPLLDGGVAEPKKGPLLLGLLKTIGQWEPNWKRRVSDPGSEWGMMDAPDAIDRMAVLKNMAENALYEVKRHSQEILDALEAHAAAGKKSWYQTGHPASPIPPQVPGDEVSVWIQNKVDGEWTWEAVDAGRSQEIEVPVDPIKLRHAKLFNEIFEAVGLANKTRTELPNGYYKDQFKNEPWYAIAYGDYTITIGPRKRVINIKMQRKNNEAFDSSVVKALGEKDGVTCKGGPKERECLLHAWGKDKAIEYLGTMLDMVGVLDRIVGSID